jgi:hypothetical protein
MKAKTRSKRKLKNISMGQIPPAVGYQIAPAAPAGGLTNVAAMRPTFSFLPYNQDLVNKREYEDKAQWRRDNPTAPDSQYPGMADPFGRDRYTMKNPAYAKAWNACFQRNAGKRDIGECDEEAKAFIN